MTNSGRRISLKRAIALSGAVLLAVLVTSAMLVWPGNAPEQRASSSATSKPPPPRPRPLEIMPLSKQEAMEANAAIPFSTAPIEPAVPFVLSPENDFGRSAALDCLTAAIYYEATSESVQGQRAVAQVVLNRVRHPAFPSSICDVVYQGSERRTGCQFTFTCDGSLARKPSRDGWDRARRVATSALSGMVESSVGTATHYHADWVLPAWAPELDKITVIGAHIFYRWRGYWGKRNAFSQRYAGELTLSAANPILPVELAPADTPIESGMGSANRINELLAPLMDRERHIQEDELVSPPVVDVSSGTLLADERKSPLVLDNGTAGGPNVAAPN